MLVTIHIVVAMPFSEALNANPRSPNADPSGMASFAEQSPSPTLSPSSKKNTKLDLSLSIFMQWANANSAPAIMFSSGIVPVIRALLEELLDGKGLATLIGIVANQT
jgi:hypothetical protein